MHKKLLFAIIASIATTNAYSDQVLTSRAYVDNADAQKVNIAQGVGTNNANVGKTLVVNSQGNLELGTVSADNFVEDDITDGVTNKAPSENAVHDALADKQDKITTAEVGMNGFDLPALVSYDTTNGLVGNRIGILDQETVADDELYLSIYNDLNYPDGEMDNYVPTVRAVVHGLNNKQDAISTAEVAYTEPEEQINYQLPSLVTYDSANGVNGTRIGLVDLDNGGDGISFLAADINPRDSVNAVYDNYVPTFRTVAVGLKDIWSNMPSRVFWNNSLQTPINNYSTAFSSASNTWPNNQQNFVPTAQTLANGLALKQNKIPARQTKIKNDDAIYAPSVVTNGTTDGAIGQMAIVTDEYIGDHGDGGTEFEDYSDNVIPTAAAVSTELKRKQNKLGGGSSKAGKVVTATATAGNVTYTAIDGTVTNASSNLVTSGAVYTAVSAKQNKMTCTRWLDTPENPDHTDENCLLWELSN